MRRPKNQKKGGRDPEEEVVEKRFAREIRLCIEGRKKNACADP